MKIMQISVKLPLFPPVFVNLLVLCFLINTDILFFYVYTHSFFEEMFPSGFDRYFDTLESYDHEHLCSQNACFKMLFVEKSFNTTEITGLDC